VAPGDHRNRGPRLQRFFRDLTAFLLRAEAALCGCFADRDYLSAQGCAAITSRDSF
jgi:hypothetical protein